MSFSEAIIIPYEMFRKCKFTRDDGDSPSKTILTDSTLSPDVKLKLYNQQRQLQTTDDPNSKKKESYPKADATDDTSYIVDLMPEKDQPYINSILNKIRDNSEEISWNNNMEIRIDGKPYPGSNIIQLLKYIIKDLVITRGADVPKGADNFIHKLKGIGIPKSWIRIPNVRQSARLDQQQLKRTRTRSPEIHKKKQDAADGDEIQTMDWITL